MSKLWELNEQFVKDSHDQVSNGELIHRLTWFVQQDNRSGFDKELDRIFLGGAWGFMFKILAQTENMHPNLEISEGGYLWPAFAQDIRDLLWIAMQKKLIL